MGKASKSPTRATTAHTAFVNKCQIAVDLFYAHKFDLLAVSHDSYPVTFEVSKESQVIKTTPKTIVDGAHFIKSDRIRYSLQPGGNVIMSIVVANINKLPQLIDILLKEKVAFELLH